MAGVTLDQVWLHDDSDYSDYVRLLVQTLQSDAIRQVDRRMYTAGRVRAISRPGVIRDITFDTTLVGDVALGWMDARLGERLMFRGPRGRVYWGFLSSLPATELPGGSEYVRQSLTFQVTSGTAEV